MAFYTALAPEPRIAGEPADPSRFIFVKEGFCWPALFIPELWLLFRRMWLIFLAYLVVGVGIILAGPHVGDAIGLPVVVLARFLFALEGNGLRRWTLEGRGYGLVGVVEARNAREAEVIYFHRLQDARAATPAAPPTPPKPSDKPAAEPEPIEPSEVVGLFPSPGGGS